MALENNMENERKTQKNAITFEKEFLWLSNKIEYRLNHFFKIENAPIIENLNAPDHEEDQSEFALFLKKAQLNETERLILITALASQFKPVIFDRFQIKNKITGRTFTEFGGKISDKFNQFIPTLRTVTFIVNQTNLVDQFEIRSYFEEAHFFRAQNILRLETNNNSSLLEGTFLLGEEFLQLITLGIKFKPSYRNNFPAEIITTSLEWNDLVLEDSLMDEINLLDTWLAHKKELDLDTAMQKKINKGYKCLFFGAPGTGKTLTATLLGKKNDIDVYRVDLSQVVSKYIGETEKNLGVIFDLAENKNWILFFDEAESLFSKRTAVGDSKDKYANQETAYLLQRIENYNGLVILATNLKPNIDLAFSRRIQSMIHYSIPNSYQRFRLWTNALKGIIELNDNEITKIAEAYEISGGAIKNIIQFAWLKAKSLQQPISKETLLIGIRRELSKDGKSFERS